MQRKRVNAVEGRTEALNLFMVKKCLTVSQVAEVIGKNYTTAMRRTKALLDRGQIEVYKHDNGAGSVGPGEIEYRITLQGIGRQLSYLATHNKTHEDLLELLKVVASIHPELCYIFKYLEYFEKNGYDLKPVLLNVLLSQVISDRLDALTVTIEPLVIDNITICVKTLLFSAYKHDPMFYTESLNEKGLSLDWLLGLWRISDTIPKLRELRGQTIWVYEDEAKRVLENLDKWLNELEKP